MSALVETKASKVNRLKVQNNFDSYLLRQVNLSDISNLVNVVSNNLTHLCKWLPWVGDVYNASDAKNFIIQSCEKFNNAAGADYAVIASDAIIGIVGIHSINWDDRLASIGFWMSSSYCGKGIATSAVRKLFAYLFDDLLLQKIVLTVAEDNTASSKVAKKLGMESDGLLIKPELLHGKYINHVAYRLENWVRK
ncbi:MAG: GNAT family protein [Gammaproteobacteria bacterium]|nr:GNAT family protein [Gammaproteobacteria bacterium]